QPPKSSKSKKVAKAKASAVVDCLSTEEMSKEQLEEHIVRLREELDREREEKSFFQLERDKIREFWEISKRSLEEAKAELRSRQREREEEEERHRVEISVFKQKLKNVLSEHQDAMTEVKMDGVAAASLLQSSNTQAEFHLRMEVHGLQSNRREKEQHSQNFFRELQLKHQVELMDLASSYDRRIKETEEKHLKNLQAVLEAEGKQRQAEIQKLDEQMRSRLVSLKEEHEGALRGAEEYYSAVQRKLLEDQRLLKREQTEATKVQAQALRELSAAQQEKRRLREAVRDAEGKLLAAQEQLERSRKEKARMKVRNVRGRQVEKELRDQKVEHQLLLQCSWELERERDDLLRRQKEAVLELQQKMGLKEQLLQKKIAALRETLEKREAQLYAVLSTANLEPSAASEAAQKLQDILESKEAAVEALQRELS
uniref:Dynein regulatory complex subunit 4 n=1 Tax=Tetraodon nigroviridis TaxID=99883 RepID=H3CAM5_TETNG